MTDDDNSKDGFIHVQQNLYINMLWCFLQHFVEDFGQIALSSLQFVLREILLGAPNLGIV